jgi:cyclic pyranopterin phosphate synthase
MNSPLVDTFGRPMKSLRLSVTDRCNLRCSYCMPESDYRWLPRSDLLTFEEIGRLLPRFVDLGTTRIRITGGEPLLRSDLPVLVRRVAALAGVEDLALTTTGVFLAREARGLRDAGLHRITVSLDTLSPARFRSLSRSEEHAKVLDGIVEAGKVGFSGLKLDTVVIRGVNDDEIPALLRAAREWSAEIRFIEYMDVGGALRWTPEAVVSQAEILAKVESSVGPVEPLRDTELSAPARRFRTPSGQVFGVVASMTQPFCTHCDRSRLTADGTWYHCLYAPTGVDLRTALRAPGTDAELGEVLTSAWKKRADRGAELRMELRNRAPSVAREDLRADPRLEMHTRGG